MFYGRIYASEKGFLFGLPLHFDNRLYINSYLRVKH